MLMFTLCSKPADNLKSGRYGFYSQCWIRIRKSQKYPYPFQCSMILRYCKPSPGNCEPCPDGHGLSSSPTIIQRDGHKAANIEFPSGFLMYLLCASKYCIFQELAQKIQPSTLQAIIRKSTSTSFRTLKLHSQVTRNLGALDFQASQILFRRLICSPSLQWHLVEKKKLEMKNNWEGKCSYAIFFQLHQTTLPQCF